MSKPADTDTTAPACEYLTFALGAEEYGVDILKVQEIRGYDAVTRLPEAPDYIKGVVNLRGLIVPVVDMRVKFVGQRVVGMVVDAVSDVLQLDAAQVSAVPDLAGSAIDRKFLTGIGLVDERMLVLIDIEQLMTSAEMGLVAEAVDALEAEAA